MTPNISSPTTPPAEHARRTSLAHLSTEARKAIAFLDAEEQMIELRLARRTGGSPNVSQHIRSEFSRKRDDMIRFYEKNLMTSGMQRTRGALSRSYS